MLNTLDQLYQHLFAVAQRIDAQTAHHLTLETLRAADPLYPAVWLAENLPKANEPVHVGGVDLPAPFILSAGLVKGDGFETEADAIQAVRRGHNIIPGWRVIPALVGAVEFGSFTRYPRVGNPGTVLWRDVATQSTQNRIGLRNPGAEAAALFLSVHMRDATPIFGINIAVSPGVDDPVQEKQEALEAVGAFIKRGVIPAWFTLNLSCPNTEDDPQGNQTAAKAYELCGAMVEAVGDVPLWVKVGTCLSDEQYVALMTAFAQTGVRAVIATNTLPAPTRDGSAMAGIGGGKLHDEAVKAVKSLKQAQNGADVAIIGCGGVTNGNTYRQFREAGADAVMYYSAMIYRSPLAAAIIYEEAK